LDALSSFYRDGITETQYKTSSVLEIRYFDGVVDQRPVADQEKYLVERKDQDAQTE